MKLGTLKRPECRDGQLALFDRKLERLLEVREPGGTLQAVLDDWQRAAPELQRISDSLNHDESLGRAFSWEELAAPLPRAYQWLDGSAYLCHVERVRKARGATMPPSFLVDPLMYQGGSDSLSGPRDPILVANESWGIDFEAEVAVITDDVPMGLSTEEAADHIVLLLLVNDVSLRNLIPDELAKGFGFLNGKPSSAFSPVAVTPDELGEAWDGKRLHGALQVFWNGDSFGHADAGRDMHFDFPRLISHAAKTRRLEAGTLVGSGTVSNRNLENGFSCIAEKRLVEMIEKGEATTPFMRFGDRVRIEMIDKEDRSMFGAIDQMVEPWP
ncbi:MAG: fumarylacetoacetate hydrolase family protein [Gammaproteobacteria bacterium]